MTRGIPIHTKSLDEAMAALSNALHDALVNVDRIAARIPANPALTDIEAATRKLRKIAEWA